MSNRAVGIEGLGERVVDLRDDDVAIRDAEIYLREPGFYESSVKPVIDFIGASLLIILFSPLMLASAVAVYASLGGPILLKQPRVGRGGKVFEVYKFRTMHPDRRTNEQPFVGEDRRISHKRPDDPRLTPTGEFLRKWSLDELPQFFNVIRGEMSLVGPRPELVSIVAKYEPWQHQRHAVKPGITGLWQVSERGDRMLHEATDIDIDYLDTLSFWRDVTILAQTPLVMLGMRPGF